MVRVFRRYREERIREPSTHPFYQALGKEDLVFAAETRRFSTPEVAATLSVRTVLGGRALHRLGRSVLAVEPGRLLVLNDGQPYRVEIESTVPVESFGVYFARDTVAGVVSAFERRPLEAVLEFEPGGRSPRFLDRMLPVAALEPELGTLRRLARATEEVEPLRAEEEVSRLLERLLRVQLGLVPEIERLGALRASTRRELYRRLHRARDYLHAHYAEDLAIRDLSRVAMLSPFHFQRLFRELFGVTVHGYLTRLRMEAARRLLVTTSLPIAAIARRVGYGHHASFTRVFTRTQGVTPSSLRGFRAS